MTHIPDAEYARDEKSIKRFADEHEATVAYSAGIIGLQEKIIVNPSPELLVRLHQKDAESHHLETCVGRILFNQIFPVPVPFCNNKVDKKVMGEIISLCLELLGMAETAKILDDIKDLCGEYLTQSGLSFGMDDIPTLTEKPEIIKRRRSGSTRSSSSMRWASSPSMSGETVSSLCGRRHAIYSQNSPRLPWTEPVRCSPLSSPALAEPGRSSIKLSA